MRQRSAEADLKEVHRRLPAAPLVFKAADVASSDLKRTG